LINTRRKFKIEEQITNEFMKNISWLSFPLVGNLAEGRRILDKPE